MSERLRTTLEPEKEAEQFLQDEFHGPGSIAHLHKYAFILQLPGDEVGRSFRPFLLPGLISATPVPVGLIQTSHSTSRLHIFFSQPASCIALTHLFLPLGRSFIGRCTLKCIRTSTSRHITPRHIASHHVNCLVSLALSCDSVQLSRSRISF